jgi:hypothetical protein
MITAALTGLAVVLFLIAVYARHRMLREERRRPGYIHRHDEDRSTSGPGWPD